jgi:hypothetical protein
VFGFLICAVTLARGGDERGGSVADDGDKLVHP